MVIFNWPEVASYYLRPEKRLPMASISHVVACEVDLALCHRVYGLSGTLTSFTPTPHVPEYE